MSKSTWKIFGLLKFRKPDIRSLFPFSRYFTQLAIFFCFFYKRTNPKCSTDLLQLVAFLKPHLVLTGETQCKEVYVRWHS